MTTSTAPRGTAARGASAAGSGAGSGTGSRTGSRTGSGAAPGSRWLIAARPWSTIAAALATLGTGIVVWPLVETPAWLGPTLFAVAAVAATGLIMRGLRVPAALHPLAAIVVLVEVLTLLFARDVAAFGFLPGPVALEELRSIAQQGAEVSQTFAAPVPPEPGIVLLIAAGIGITAVVVDVLGVSLRLAALAGGALLVLYAVPAAILRGGLDWWFLPLGAAGWLLLLAADTADQARAWGPPLRRPPGSGPARRAGPAAHPGGEVGGGPDIAAAGLVALAAVVLALAVPTAIPGLGEPVWGSGRGEAIGGTTPDDGAISLDPFVSLRRNLIDNTGREVLTYTTDGAGGSYLRMVTLEEFDGVTWSSAAAPVQYPVTENLGVPLRASSGPVGFDIRVGPLDNPSLPVPYAAVSAEGIGEPLDSRWAWDPNGRTIQGDGVSSEGLAYSVVSYEVQPTRAQLRTATSDNIPELTRLPADLPADLSRLAAEVTRGERTPYGRAAAIERWLTRDGGFAYSTGVSSTPGVDPLQEFLDDRIGYCEQFAATMALMARSVGIPSRVVIGFTGGRQLQDGSWQVQARNAHAWPELWFDGVGWVWFEPTPRDEAGAGVTAPPYSDVPDRAGADIGPDPEDTTAPQPIDDGPLTDDESGSVPWPWLALLAVAVVLAAIVGWRRQAGRVRRTLRTRSAEPRRRIEGAWEEVGTLARGRGLPWAPSASPRAAEDSLRRTGQPDAAAGDALAELRWWVEQMRYAAPDAAVDAPEPRELRDWLTAVDDGLGGASKRG